MGVELKQIEADKIDLNFIEAIGKDWMLVTSGNQQSFNMMTASWGFAGYMWGMPSTAIVIRPTRFTKEFIDKLHTYTLSFFPDKYKKILSVLGSKSGREIDKMKESGLTPMQLPTGDIGYEEASLTIACRVVYARPIDETGFLDSAIMPKWYPAGAEDLHALYIGEIQAVYQKGKSSIFG